MTLLESLGIDPDNFKWQDLSACAGMPTSWFYEDYESDSIIAKNIDEVCLRCPVMRACGNTAVANKEQGVWGAVFRDGGKPHKIRNGHKTAEVWQRIAEED